MFENSFINRVLYKSFWLMVLPACLAWSVVVAFHRPAVTSLNNRMAVELPSQWQGQPLRPLALGDVEQRFMRQFPGTLNRMTTGEEVLVLRTVEKPTRMLHPAADCYQGLGYRIAAQRLELDREQHLWRCFEALRDGRRVRVCERIVDASGQGFTDASAWYWSAVLGRSRGPWQAITVARPL